MKYYVEGTQNMSIILKQVELFMIVAKNDVCGQKTASKTSLYQLKV